MARTSVQEPNIELSLELTNLRTDRWLSEVKSLSGPTEVQLFGHCDQDT
jgi:hypothetical protein